MQRFGLMRMYLAVVVLILGMAIIGLARLQAAAADDGDGDSSADSTAVTQPPEQQAAPAIKSSASKIEMRWNKPQPSLV